MCVCGRVWQVGQVHKAGASPSSFFTAHPKIDPLTKRLYAFGYDLVGPLYI
jgi:carotenoid cleavage dioxygenase-like enzyme